MPHAIRFIPVEATAQAVATWRVPGGYPLAAAKRSRPVAVGPCPTHRSLDRWARQLLGSVKHERRVVELATDLFGVTRSMHGLGVSDLRLLRWAAMVHDVGRSVCDETHPQEGARLLSEDRRLPLSADQRRALTFLTRFHRGKPPAIGQDGILRPGDDVHTLRLLLALLRSADALDSRSLCSRSEEPPTVTFSLVHGRWSPPVLEIVSSMRHISAKARKVYAKRKKFRLLEELLGLRTRLDVTLADSRRAVA